MSNKKLEENSGDALGGEISRRQWLMKLGEATFFFGFSGSAAGVPSSMTPDLQALPPGIYEPSSEHMARALTSDQRYVKIPAGSETDYVRPRQGPFRPAFFNDHEFGMIQQLVKLTLGPPPKGTAQTSATELNQTIAEIAEWIDLVVSQAASVSKAAHQLSPQHRALAAAYYGKEAVEKLESEDPGRVCRDGLKWFDDKSAELHGVPFLNLNEPAQIDVAKLAANATSMPDH